MTLFSSANRKKFYICFVDIQVGFTEEMRCFASFCGYSKSFVQARFVPVSAEHKVAESQFTLNSQGCMEKLHVTCDNYPCNMDSIRKKKTVLRPVF